MSNAVTHVPAASPEVAFEHFSREFEFETDCWDTHETLMLDEPGFVLLDVRGPALYERGHVPGALNLPHGKIIRRRMETWPKETLFVVYCAGPHCNGAAKAARRLAELGRPVKLMAGGVTGWLDEGFVLAEGAEPSSVRALEAA